MSAGKQKILVIGPSWVGDMVMSQSLLTSLREMNPDCVIDVLAPSWSLPILQRMPEVNAALALPLGHGDLKLRSRYRIGRSLAAGGYDQAIVLPNSLKSALIPFFASIPLRTGWRGEMRYGLLNDIRILDKARLPMMVQRFTALAYPPDALLPHALPRPKLSVSESNSKSLQQKFGLPLNKPALVICPGAEFGDAKKWPETHFATVADRKISEGWQVWILGSSNDRAVAETIFGLISQPNQKQCIDLSGHTALEDTIDILSLADLVLCNDSGLMHIAAAVNTPLMVVYGSTSPDFTPPLGDQVKIFKSDISCAPCFKRHCKYSHKKCLLDQKPDKILSAFPELVKAP